MLGYVSPLQPGFFALLPTMKCAVQAKYIHTVFATLLLRKILESVKHEYLRICLCLTGKEMELWAVRLSFRPPLNNKK